jgi:hypothetical protein
MLSATVVVPLPAEIFCGEKVAMAPAGRPEDAKVIAGSVVPEVGVTTREYSAVSPGDTLDGVLPLTVILNDGTIGAIAALTVTKTVADALAGLALPDPCGVGLVVLGYWAVRVYVPTAREVMGSVATPEEFRTAVPITVEPFMKLTVPVGTLVPLSLTDAVRTSA